MTGISTGTTLDRTFLDALLADGPHPAQGDALMTFGQFVGSWDLRLRFFDPAGDTTIDVPARWSFAWVLDGRAVQDVLVRPAANGSLQPGERGIGTTLRYLESGAGTWRVVWLGATSHRFITLIGQRVGEDIVIEGDDVDGRPLRWMFTDITRDGFHWQGYISDDSGGSWRLEQDMLARRADSTEAAR